MRASASRAATDLDRERLAKILGMLGSGHDGEVVNAARQAEQLRSSAGITWFDILRPPPVPAVLEPEPEPKRQWKPKASTERPKRRNWPKTFDLAKQAHIELACDFVLEAGVANEWELGFLASIHEWPALSQKQTDTLLRLIRKARDAQKSPL